MTSAEIREDMRQKAGYTLLAFSGGKDACATWLALRASGIRVYPVFLYLVPGLQFIERSLAYYERFFETPILRLPHPTLAAWLRDATFASPERAAQLAGMNVPNLKFSDCWVTAKRRLGLPADAWVALGVRASDSPQRWINYRRLGAVRESSREWWPIWDWRQDAVAEAFRGSGLKLSDEYRWFGRSFDGIDARFVEPLAQHAPDDYARLREWFPLIEAERWFGRYGREHDGQS